jgi:hypothetical protein
MSRMISAFRPRANGRLQHPGSKNHQDECRQSLIKCSVCAIGVQLWSFGIVCQTDNDPNSMQAEEQNLRGVREIRASDIQIQAFTYQR